MPRRQRHLILTKLLPCSRKFQCSECKSEISKQRLLHVILIDVCTTFFTIIRMMWRVSCHISVVSRNAADHRVAYTRWAKKRSWHWNTIHPRRLQNQSINQSTCTYTSQANESSMCSTNFLVVLRRIATLSTRLTNAVPPGDPELAIDSIGVILGGVRSPDPHFLEVGDRPPSFWDDKTPLNLYIITFSQQK